MRFRKVFLIILIVLLLFFVSSLFCQSKNEKYFQNIAVKELKGIGEIQLVEGVRVDIITDSFAIEVDFAFKFYEAVGQSLYYSILIKKKPGIVVIVKNKDDYRKFDRLLMICKVYKIRLWKIDYFTNKLVSIL